MKYISLLVIVLALQLSWNVSNCQRDIDLTTHTAVQNELEELIRNYVQNARPEAKDIIFHRLWTKATSPSAMKAFFEYSYSDTTDDGDRVQQTIFGEAVLNKNSESPVEETWSLEKVQASNNAIEFENGVTITPGGLKDDDSQ